MKSTSAKPRSEQSAKHIADDMPQFDAPGQLEHVARRVEEHGSLHEMVLSIAQLCEDRHNQLKSDESEPYYIAAIWPGLRILMDRMSAEGDELLRNVRYTQKQLVEKDRAR